MSVGVGVELWPWPGHVACNQTVCVAIFDYRLTDFVLNQLRHCPNVASNAMGRAVSQSIRAWRLFI